MTAPIWRLPRKASFLRAWISQSSIAPWSGDFRRRGRASRGRTRSSSVSRAAQELLVAGQRKVIVFSFFIGTIDYLARRLEAFELDGERLEVLKLYGPSRATSAAIVVQRFPTTEGPAVLLSSEVGSEGLDFQFCSAMFNYDLPWNPMRVEQRIGRLDRYGQQAKTSRSSTSSFRARSRAASSTRLYERISIFEQSIGDLEAILGDREVDADLGP